MCFYSKWVIEKCCIRVKENATTCDVKANMLVSMMATKLAGVGVETNEWFHLYLRPSAHEELGFLNTYRTSCIRGPPGTGKSVVAWFFALRAALSEKQVLWCHYVKTTYTACLLTKSGVKPLSEEPDFERLTYVTLSSGWPHRKDGGRN